MAHSGTSTAGAFVQTMVLTDIATGWSECVPVVMRAGAPALEVTVTDGRGAVVAVFLGRRKVAGMSPGRRVALAGMAAESGKRFVMVNPAYELLS